MNSLEKFLFIVNPKSGTNRNKNIQTLIKESKLFENEVWEVKETQYAGHAVELVKDAIAANIRYIVAVGGDGTMNEVASVMRNTNSVMGIIPMGSGNGLARHLNIPLDILGALETLLHKNVKTIDSCFLDQTLFFCTSGLGFDACVSERFAQLNSRGIQNYIKASFSEYFRYKPLELELTIDGVDHRFENVFACTFANAAQFGNNAVIAPSANISDGIVEISILKMFPLWASPTLAYRLFTSSIDKSKYFTGLRGKSITIKKANTRIAHIDGDPLPVTFPLQLEVSSNDLSLLLP